MEAKKPLLLALLGVPGSGKSYFARNLALEIGAVHLNSDSMRLAIFKSTDETTKIYNSEDRPKLNTYVFGALDYVSAQILGSSTNLIYDANNNSREERVSLEKIAQEHRALAVVVWIKTPHELALKRGQERTATNEQRQLSADVMRDTIAKHAAKIDEPKDDEHVVIIDGTIPFDEQYVSFTEQLETII